MFFERILLPVFCLGFEVFSSAFAEDVEIRDVAADKGTDVTVPCGGLELPSPNVHYSCFYI
ncbi:Pentatricopeptide repeat protein [Operophtera brumata]|uniref:Pentatricopeptide repeat protein n=1 Tax=Operophtera brumata TaxID=104452 RepID=A0A0L7LEL4_OPEBR|nr:Pentatricopeptide repeat protein [Operophtera brumata]